MGESTRGEGRDRMPMLRRYVTKRVMMARMPPIQPPAMRTEVTGPSSAAAALRDDDPAAPLPPSGCCFEDGLAGGRVSTSTFSFPASHSGQGSHRPSRSEVLGSARFSRCSTFRNVSSPLAPLSPCSSVLIISREARGWSIGTMCPEFNTLRKRRLPCSLTYPAGATGEEPSSRGGPSHAYLFAKLQSLAYLQGSRSRNLSFPT
mmetsp:Transcript_16018/g.46067  ORF Transcript_16018/g.46067 Transcript_16018/m.46067 type:complete len:204 (+) Transcript_16018:141-752(+)